MHAARYSLTGMESTLGARISQVRAEKSLSQRDVAKRMDCSEQQISAWERDSKKPSLENAEKLAAALEVDLGWLISGAGKMAPRKAS